MSTAELRLSPFSWRHESGSPAFVDHEDWERVTRLVVADGANPAICGHSWYEGSLNAETGRLDLAWVGNDEDDGKATAFLRGADVRPEIESFGDA